MEVVFLLVGADAAVADGLDIRLLVEVGIDVVAPLSGGGLECRDDTAVGVFAESVLVYAQER